LPVLFVVYFLQNTLVVWGYLDVFCDILLSLKNADTLKIIDTAK